MKKIYLANGKEVQLGDTICKVKKIDNPVLGKGKSVEYILVTKEVLPKLIESGVLTVKKDAEGGAKKVVSPDTKDVKLPIDLNFYIQKIADRLGWKIEKLFNYLNSIDNIYPAASFSIVLKEIAIQFDKNYEGHIKNSPEIYVISLLDGEIHKVDKSHICNYRNFAAFRSLNDAKTACKITEDILKELFSDK